MTAFLLLGLFVFPGPADAKIGEAELSQKVQKQEQSYRQVIGSLYKINRKVRALVFERSKMDQEKRLVETQAKILAEKIVSLEKQESDTRKEIIGTIRHLHQFNQKAFSDYVFKAQNPAQIERNMKLLGIVAQKDMQSLKDYQMIRVDLQKKRHSFLARLNEIKSLEGKIQLKEQDLIAENKKRTEYLTGLKISQADTLKKLRSIQAKKSGGRFSDSGVLDGLSDEPFQDQKGQLLHPVQTQVAKTYGFFKDTNDQLVFSHRGWFYQSYSPLPVQSVFRASVAFLGRIPEFGQVVILDHGDHYYTVYGGMAEIKVKVGDQLRAGELLGMSGHVPYNSGQGLYFEIRHYSETMDPKLWMKGSTYEITNLDRQ